MTEMQSWATLRERCGRLLGYPVPSHANIALTIHGLLNRLEAAEAGVAGAVFVCTLEPYHDNGELVGVATSLEAARKLLGYPDPGDWQDGDPGNNLSVWYTTKAEPMPTIRMREVTR